MKAFLGNIVFFGSVAIIIVSNSMGSDKLLPYAYGALVGYLLRVIGECIDESRVKK